MHGDGYAESFVELPGSTVPEDVASAFQNAVFARLRTALSDLGEDRFTAKRLEKIAAPMRTIGDVDVLSIMWQHRLLGYVDGRHRLRDPVVFYGPDQDRSLHLPEGKAHYAVHPILIDVVDRLRGVATSSRRPDAGCAPADHATARYHAGDMDRLNMRRGSISSGTANLRPASALRYVDPPNLFPDARADSEQPHAPVRRGADRVGR